MNEDENDVESYAIQYLKNLKFISLKLNLIEYYDFKIIVEKLFYGIEKLRITTNYDATYSDALSWENLITSSMPNLRVFDLNHEGFVSVDNELNCDELINQFKSSFWMEKQWNFTHQHNWIQQFNNIIFYSNKPYK